MGTTAVVMTRKTFPKQGSLSTIYGLLRTLCLYDPFLAVDSGPVTTSTSLGHDYKLGQCENLSCHRLPGSRLRCCRNTRSPIRSKLTIRFRFNMRSRLPNVGREGARGQKAQIYEPSNGRFLCLSATRTGYTAMNTILTREPYLI
nr:hypothetical protein CFP56_71317 [Quercus suber]